MSPIFRTHRGARIAALLLGAVILVSLIMTFGDGLPMPCPPDACCCAETYLCGCNSAAADGRTVRRCPPDSNRCRR